MAVGGEFAQFRGGELAALQVAHEVVINGQDAVGCRVIEVALCRGAEHLVQRQSARWLPRERLFLAAWFSRPEPGCSRRPSS